MSLGSTLIVTVMVLMSLSADTDMTAMVIVVIVVTVMTSRREFRSGGELDREYGSGDKDDE